MKFWLT